MRNLNDHLNDGGPYHHLICAFQIMHRDVILRTHSPKYRHSNDHSNYASRCNFAYTRSKIPSFKWSFKFKFKFKLRTVALMWKQSFISSSSLIYYARWRKNHLSSLKIHFIKKNMEYEKDFFFFFFFFLFISVEYSVN